MLIILLNFNKLKLILKEKVYEKIMKMPKITLKEHLKRYYSVGPIAGLLFLVIIIFDLIFYVILRFLEPDNSIDIAVDVPYKKYFENKDKFGNHKFTLFKEKEKEFIK